MSLTELTHGTKIKVIKAFEDFDGRPIKIGTTLTYRSHDYFVYDGGYTFHFEEETIRLAEIDESNDQVLTQFSMFFEVIE